MSYPCILSYGQSIHEEIDDERHRQEGFVKSGRFARTCASMEMTDGERYAVLGEEFGEVGRAILEKMRLANDTHHKDLRKELIQVAAVCVAWIQGLDADPAHAD